MSHEKKEWKSEKQSKKKDNLNETTLIKFIILRISFIMVETTKLNKIYI